MRLLERYILAELLRVFAVLITLTTILLMFVGVVGQVREYGLGPWQVIQILPFIIPMLLPYTIPTTLLLTVCVVYGRMGGDREIIAAKAAGIKVMSLLWPSYFLSGVLAVATLLTSDQVIPWANTSIERIVMLAMEDILLDVLRTQNQVNIREAGVSITVMGVKDRTLLNPTFRFSPGGKKPTMLRAQEAQLKFDLQKRQVLVEMKHVEGDAAGQARFWRESISSPFRLPDQSQKLQIRNLRLQDITNTIQQVRREAEEARRNQAIEVAFAMTTGDFYRLTDIKMIGKRALYQEQVGLGRRLRTEYHGRFAMATSCLFFALFGSPFAILAGKKQFLTTFLFVFTPILLVYYPVIMMTQNMSKTGSLEPSIWVWAANAILLVAAGIALRLVTRH